MRLPRSEADPGRDPGFPSFKKGQLTEAESRKVLRNDGR